MKPLFNFGIRTLLDKINVAYNGDRQATVQNIARIAAKSLSFAEEVLHDRGMYFEATAAEDLRKRFDRVNGQTYRRTPETEDDGYYEDFEILWEEFMEWADQDASVTGKPRRLADVPSLPIQFT